MKKTLYRNVVLIEFLSEEPIDPESDLEALIYEATEGCLSMSTTDKIVNKPIKGKAAVKALDKHGTDYEFFGIDSKGNEVNNNEED